MKKIILIPGVLFSLILILFIIAGMPFCLNFVKVKLTTIIQNELSIPIQIESVKGNLFYTIEISEISVDNILRINKLKISYNVLKLLSKEVDVNSLLIDGLDADMNRLDSLMQSLVKKENQQEKQKKSAFKVRIRQLSAKNSELFGLLNNRNIDVDLNVEGKLLSDVFFIDTLIIKTDGSNISIRGQVPVNEEGSLSIAYNMYLLLDEFDFDGLNIKGSVVSRGRVQGNMTALHLTSSAELDVSYQENNITGTINFVWQAPDLENLIINAEVNMKTPPLRKGINKKDQWQLSLDAQGRKLVCNVSSLYGKMQLKGHVKGEIENPELFGEVAGRFKYMSFKPEIKGKIAYQKDMISLRDFKISSRELSVKCNASAAAEKPQKISADVSVSCNDMSFINEFIETPLQINGKMNLLAQIKGTVQEPVLAGRIKLEEIQMFNERITNADFKVTYKNSAVIIDSGIINSPRGIIVVDGVYKLADSTFRTHIKSDKIVFKAPEIIDKDTILVSGDVAFDINLYGNTSNPTGEGEIYFKDITYDTLNLGNYSIQFNLKDSVANIDLLNKDTSLHLMADARTDDPFYFNAQLNLRHFNLKNYTPADEAFISGQIIAQGEVTALENVTGTVQIDTIFASLQPNTIQNMEAINIAVNKRVIDIISCVFAVHDQRIFLKGHLPLDFTKGDVNLRIKASRIEIADLIALIPDVPAMSGIVFVDVDVKGPLKNPLVNGKLVLENIKCSIPDLAIDSVFSLIVFNNRLMNIEYLKGRINRGTFNMNGFASLSETGLDTVNITISLDKIDVRNKEFGTAVFSSTMYASAKKENLRIDGEVIINKAVYDVPFNLQTIIKILTKVNQPPQEQLDMLKKVYGNLDVSAPTGINIKNNVADVNADVDLQIRGHLSKVNVYGTVATSEKGTIRYLGKQFDVASAVMQFDNPYEIDPILEIDASSFVSSVDGDYEIFMHLSGTIKDWRLELTSSPPVPEQDIVSLLIMGRRRPGTQVGKGVGLKGAAKDYAMGMARGTIEKTAERKLGAEKFTITGDLLKPRQLDIGIEKRFAKKFTLIYGTGIESWELRRIGINYDLTDNLSIFTLHDQENVNSSVDLDIHFELE